MAAALAGKAVLEMDRYLQEVFETSSTIYSKAMDAGRSTFSECGPNHRLFDGGHTIAGAWDAVREALPNDKLSEEAIGFLAADCKDLVAPMGMQITNLSRVLFDQVSAAASKIGVEADRRPQGFLKLLIMLIYSVSPLKKDNKEWCIVTLATVTTKVQKLNHH